MYSLHGSVLLNVPILLRGRWQSNKSSQFAQLVLEYCAWQSTEGQRVIANMPLTSSFMVSGQNQAQQFEPRVLRLKVFLLVISQLVLVTSLRHCAASGMAPRGNLSPGVYAGSLEGAPMQMVRYMHRIHCTC